MKYKVGDKVRLLDNWVAEKFKMEDGFIGAVGSIAVVCGVYNHGCQLGTELETNKDLWNTDYNLFFLNGEFEHA